jgi:hypothetical protein
MCLQGFLIPHSLQRLIRQVRQSTSSSPSRPELCLKHGSYALHRALAGPYSGGVEANGLSRDCEVPDPRVSFQSSEVGE